MAVSKHDERIVFDCEQYDQYALKVHCFVLLYYYKDGSVEMIRRRDKKTHLKRTKIPSLQISDFFVGATVSIFGILTRITACADEVTRQLCAKRSEKTAVLIPESALRSLGRYISILIEECEFTIAGLQMGQINDNIVRSYDIPAQLCGMRVVVIEAVRSDALLKGKEFTSRAPQTFAAIDLQQVCLWGKLCVEWSQTPVAVFDKPNCTVVLLKPHTISRKCCGCIIQELLDLGLSVTGLSHIFADSNMLKDFFSPYRGVLPDFLGTIESLVGNIWAVQLMSLDNVTSAVDQVRKACGPYDSKIAKKLFPNSIRAKYGVDATQNAVHCCELDEETPMYTKTFFKSSKIKQ